MGSWDRIWTRNTRAWNSRKWLFGNGWPKTMLLHRQTTGYKIVTCGAWKTTQILPNTTNSKVNFWRCDSSGCQDQLLQICIQNRTWCFTYFRHSDAGHSSLWAKFKWRLSILLECSSLKIFWITNESDRTACRGTECRKYSRKDSSCYRKIIQRQWSSKQL